MNTRSRMGCESSGIRSRSQISVSVKPRRDRKKRARAVNWCLFFTETDYTRPRRKPSISTRPDRYGRMGNLRAGRLVMAAVVAHPHSAGFLYDTRIGGIPAAWQRAQTS